MKYPISLGDRENSFVNIHALKNLINLKIDELVDAAPETLNTLKELADAIEQNGLDDLATKGLLEAALADKVDKSDMSTADANGHDYIEIGGIKWATMNIGANSVTDYGLYFQWGDTQGYTASQCGSGERQKYFGWANYKYSNDDGSVMTKYNEIDGKTVLEAADDAAVANWGGSWRMPTTEELRALGAAVNTVWTTDYQGSGVAGMICTDKTDSSKVLFFPAAGDCWNGRVNDVGYFSNCWSSSLVVSLYANGKSAYYMRFGSFGAIWDNTIQRFSGRAVRGVLDGGDKYATKAEVEQLQSNIVQSDWNQSDSTAIDYIKNKPNIDLKEDKVVGKGLSTNDYINEDKYIVNRLKTVGTYKPMDILFSDGTAGRDINGKTPVAICVAPSSHFPDNKARFISLKNIYQDGGLNCAWGSSIDIGNLHNYGAVVTIDANGISSLSEASGYLPIGTEADGLFSNNIQGWFYKDFPYIPSPFNNGELNIQYCEIDQAFSDTDGKGNTLLIKNSTGASNALAAQVCLSFSPGLKDGEWYLPALGELGYVMVQQKEIEAVVDYINSEIPDCAEYANMEYWSSTEYSNKYAYEINTFNGRVVASNKAQYKQVRAFISIEDPITTVLSDWNLTDDGAADYIKNKPDISALEARIAALEAYHTT